MTATNVHDLLRSAMPPAARKAPNAKPRTPKADPAARPIHVRVKFERPGDGAVLRDQVFDRCELRNSWIRRPKASPHFVRAERLDFIGCSVRAQRGFSRVECHEILVRGMPKKSAGILANELLLDRVTFEGDFHVAWTFFWVADHLDAVELAYVRDFYARLPSFALDIRNARFTGLTLRGIPGHLVLRDPATTALVHRDRLEADRSWCKLDEWGRPADSVSSELAMFLSAEPRWPSRVLVAGTLGKRAEQDLAALNALKRAGFAE